MQKSELRSQGEVTGTNLVTKLGETHKEAFLGTNGDEQSWELIHSERTVQLSGETEKI